MILKEFYKSYRYESDFEAATISNLELKPSSANSPIYPLEIELAEGSSFGFLEFTVDLGEQYADYNDSRVFWRDATFTGAIRYEIADADHDFTELTFNGSLPFVSRFLTIRISLSGGSGTPSLYDFNISLWQEINAPEIELVTKPKDLTKDLMRLYDLNGELNAYLQNAQNPITEDVLGAQELLTFSMPFSDPKSKLILYDCEIVYKDKRYVVTDIEDGMNESGEYVFDVSCELVYVDLLNTSINEEVLISLKTVKQGLEQLLAGTKWSIDKVVDDATKYSMKESKQTLLWFIQQWAKITETEIEWDSMNYRISLVRPTPANKKAAFKYRKNLKSIMRKTKPPVATVVYAYGKNGLTFAPINNDIPYVENFDWYVEQGIPLEVARKNYRKEYIWKDERYIYMYNLKKAAEEQVKSLSRPSIAYECKVIDLSAITGRKEDTFKKGDYVDVENEDLGISVETRIVRIKKYHNEPWKNEVELGILQSGLESLNNNQSISDEVNAAQPATLFGTNEADAVNVGTSPTIGLNLAFTNFSQSHAQIGFSLIGEATEDATLTIRFSIGGSFVWNEVKQRVFQGFNSIGIPFIVQELPEGSDKFRVDLEVTNGHFLIQRKGLQLYIYASNLLGGGTGGGNPSFNVIQHFRREDEWYLRELHQNLYMDIATRLIVPIKFREGDQISPMKALPFASDIMKDAASIKLTIRKPIS